MTDHQADLLPVFKADLERKQTARDAGVAGWRNGFRGELLDQRFRGGDEAVGRHPVFDIEFLREVGALAELTGNAE